MNNRTPIIAGNWKMFKTIAEASDFMAVILPLVADWRIAEIVIFPSFISLAKVRSMTDGTNIKVGAQNMHFEASGAFTGEVSASMLTELGIDDVILGHSERREYFAETDLQLAKKITTALDSGLRPILCVGETDSEREDGKTEEKIRRQLAGGLAQISTEQLPNIVIAYEPIWAIGTGKTATPQIAQQTNSLIRQAISEQFTAAAAGDVRILYGGSVKPDNIEELMAEDDIDGALVGGASLDPDGFARIVKFG